MYANCGIYMPIFLFIYLLRQNALFLFFFLSSFTSFFVGFILVSLSRTYFVPRKNFILYSKNKTNKQKTLINHKVEDASQRLHFIQNAVCN